MIQELNRKDHRMLVELMTRALRHTSQSKKRCFNQSIIVADCDYSFYLFRYFSFRYFSFRYFSFRYFPFRYFSSFSSTFLLSTFFLSTFFHHTYYYACVQFYFFLFSLSQSRMNLHNAQYCSFQAFSLLQTREKNQILIRPSYLFIVFVICNISLDLF